MWPCQHRVGHETQGGANQGALGSHSLERLGSTLCDTLEVEAVAEGKTARSNLSVALANLAASFPARRAACTRPAVAPRVK
jgi:hypothetical protein